MTIREESTTLTKDQLLALRGLRLPKQIIHGLRDAGIYCEPSISIEYQQRTGTHVLRGRESGGATEQLGAYCCFLHADGSSIPWLDRIRAVGRNGLHAIVVATELLRIQACRNEKMYSLLITQHRLVSRLERKRPGLESKVLFHGAYGYLALDLCGEDSRFSGSVLPIFHTKGGEKQPIPEALEQAVRNVVASANCVACDHCHFAEPPEVPAIDNRVSGAIGMGEAS